MGLSPDPRPQTHPKSHSYFSPYSLISLLFIYPLTYIRRTKGLVASDFKSRGLRTDRHTMSGSLQTLRLPPVTSEEKGIRLGSPGRSPRACRGASGFRRTFGRSPLSSPQTWDRGRRGPRPDTCRPPRVSPLVPGSSRKT